MLTASGLLPLWCIPLVAMLFHCTWSLEEVACETSESAIQAAVVERALLQVRSSRREKPIKGEGAVEHTKKSRSKRKALTPYEMWALNQLALNAPLEDTDNTTMTEIRLEMAKRALTIVDVEEQPSEKARRSLTAPAIEEDSPSISEELESANESKTRQDMPADIVNGAYTSGANAGLDEEGYSTVAQICCPLEMSVYATRVITHFGYKICNEGSLQGLVAWYYCANQSRSLAELVEEINDAEDGDCAWIGTESDCPVMSANCPHFPDNSGHRRRECTKRHVETVPIPTKAPEETAYLRLFDHHCGYYQTCGKEANSLAIGAAGQVWTETESPAADCTPVCDASPDCGGFTYIHERAKCYYRMNVTCGIFNASGVDCWSKP